jgi:hypothetical protein
MPVIQVDMFSGRTMEKKRELVKALTDAFVTVTGAKAEAVHSDAQAPAGAATTRPERGQ